jgi:flagellar biosynthesis protein FliP
MDNNKKPSEPSEAERWAEMEKKIREASRQMKQQRELNRKYNRITRRILILAIIFQCIALAFQIGTLIRLVT